MKTAKKALLLVLCAIALVVASVMGTLAYLKSETQIVNNTFTAGKVAITLNEAVVNKYGVDQGTRTTTGNVYKLIAGHTYTKDPTVTVAADSEASYVRMVVTITDIDDLKAACDVTTGYFMPGEFVDEWNNNWVCIRGWNENNTGVYIFEYANTVSTVDGAEAVLPALFETFTMPENATNEEIAALGDMTISIQAYAAQADGFNSGDAAMDASFPGVFHNANEVNA